MTAPPPLPGARPSRPATAPVAPPPPPLPGKGSAKTRPRGRGKVRTDESKAMDLIEQSFHLLRSAPATALGEWLLGAIPWYATWVWLLCHLSWFRVSALDLLLGAAALVPLFGLLRVTQARCCGHLSSLLDPGAGVAPPRRAIEEVLAVFGPLLGLQMASLLVLVPFPSVHLYVHHRLLLAGRADSPATAAARHEIARAEAGRWLVVAISGAALLALLAATLTLGLLAFTFFLASLMSSLLGVPNPLVFEIGLGNPGATFTLFCLTVLTAIALVDPWWKAFVVVLHHRGRGRPTGSDLHAELSRLRQQRAAAGATLARLLPLALLLGALFAPTALPAAGAPPAPPASRIDPARWERETDQVLRREAFRWRLPPPPVEPGEEREAVLGSWVREQMQALWQTAQKIRLTLMRWWKKWFPDPDWVDPGEFEPGESIGIWPYVLASLVAVVLIVAGLLFWRWRRSTKPVATAATLAAAGAPDLQAADLDPGTRPWEDWLRLAREQAAQGQWRLALRALFLARLARLGDEGLLTLALAKTNRAYELELARRTAPEDPRPGRFRDHRLVFESIWYGRREADPGTVQTWFRDFETGGPRP